MAKVKISELQGAALDWAVAGLVHREKWRHEKYLGGPRTSMYGYSPSTDWADGGPLIDRYIGSIDVEIPAEDNAPCSAIAVVGEKEGDWKYGPTVLIAAMRAIVAAHTEGDTVDIPDELVEGSE